MAQQIYQEIFNYQAIALTLLGNGRQTINIDFEADSQFVWQKTTLVAFDSAGANLTVNTQIVPNVDVFIRNTGSGKNLMQAPVNIAQLAGDSRLPYLLPKAYQISPKSTLQFEFTNNNAIDYSKLGVVLHGVKIYSAG